MIEGYHGLHGKLGDRIGQRVGEARYSLIASGLALGVSGFLAWLFKQPLIFPSLSRLWILRRTCSSSLRCPKGPVPATP